MNDNDAYGAQFIATWANTPQTPGMQRVAAVSSALAGSVGIWAGVTIVAPNTASGIHHHGEIETVIYVVSGHGKIRWGDQMEFEFEENVEPGDFIYVPPFVPHQEINASSDTPSQWVRASYRAGTGVIAIVNMAVCFPIFLLPQPTRTKYCCRDVLAHSWMLKLFQE